MTKKYILCRQILLNCYRLWLWTWSSTCYPSTTLVCLKVKVCTAVAIGHTCKTCWYDLFLNPEPGHLQPVTKRLEVCWGWGGMRLFALWAICVRIFSPQGTWFACVCQFDVRKGFGCVVECIDQLLVLNCFVSSPFARKLRVFGYFGFTARWCVILSLS